MQGYLPDYEINPTTWAYLSSLLTIGIFFKFHRFWSVRNLDLIGLIAFSPALLWMIYDRERGAYVWLFAVGGLFLVRLLADPLMVRRPLLEPNLNASGLAFTGIALLVFLMTNVATGKMYPLATHGAGDVAVHDSAPRPLFYRMARLPEPPDERDAASQPEPSESQRARVAAVRAVAVAAHLAMVIAITLVGYRHFDNVHTGVAMASLYLLLPYTSQMTPRVDHVVPGALLVWAVASYRRPLLAGAAIGLAGALIGYPLFLLPLWCSFYWRRGLFRFVFGVLIGLVALAALLLAAIVVAKLSGFDGVGSFGDRLRETLAWAQPSFGAADGFWTYHGQALRIPVMAAFAVLCGSLALWPAQKNLGTLLSCSAAVMLAEQFWQHHQGGLYMAWYLPLLVLTIFRPNLDDRVAVTAVTEARPWGVTADGIAEWVERRLPGRRRRQPSRA